MNSEPDWWREGARLGSGSHLVWIAPAIIILPGAWGTTDMQWPEAREAAKRDGSGQDGAPGQRLTLLQMSLVQELRGPRLAHLLSPFQFQEFYD